MSYLIYINGQEVEAPNVNFARTLQVNDIGNITNRNSNFTQSIKLERTARNKGIFEQAYNVGSQTNVPYRKATCDVIDADTGLHIIYKGWAVLLESNDKEYSITIYDGVIDFYKSIDNLTLTECSIQDLNHIKSVANVINSWSGNLPYRYILADYNGNNLTPAGSVNIDFQVPSAKVSYLWEKVFEYVGFNFEGSIFDHEYFQNLWLSYPKPNSQEKPELNLITEQTSSIVTIETQWPTGDGGTFYGSASYVSFLPNSYTSIYYTQAGGATVNGLFRFYFDPAVFTLTGNFPTISSSRIGAYKINGLTISPDPIVFVNIANGNYLDISLNIGDRVILDLYYQDVAIVLRGSVTPAGSSFLNGQTQTSFNYISGFNLGFDEAFIDFKVSDLVSEIVKRFGLTLFKDKFSNTIKFLTASELLQSDEIIDLTDKFIDKISEKYTFGNYAKRNTFKYKYNDSEQTHNNGFISIDNENLNEEVTILNSLIYSPERLQSDFLTGSNVYKIWNKEIKDDETVEYKGLDGRFYFLRAEEKFQSLNIGSTILGVEQTVQKYYRESYFRLPFQNIIQDFYAPIESIFNKAKLVSCFFWFKKKDVANFDFSKLYFIEQLSSYYLVNKINNFVENKATKVDLIEVDYMKEIDIVNPPVPSYTITVGQPTLLGCNITLPITTDYPLPADVVVNVYEGSFNGFTQVNLIPQITATLSGSSIVFDVSQLPYNFYGYKFQVRILTNNPFIYIQSNLSDAIVLSGSCFIAPVYPTNLTLNSAVYNGSIPNFPFANIYRYTLNFVHTGMPSGQNYTLHVDYFASLFGNPAGWNTLSYAKTQGTLDELTQIVNVEGIYTQPTKFRIRIELVTSNEITV